MSTYNAFVFGLILGVGGYFVLDAFDKFRRKPNRTIPPGSVHRRSTEERASAIAFATFYENCADSIYKHVITSDDQERVRKAVQAFLRTERDKLGEMHLGHLHFEAGEEEIAYGATKRAEALFLQI